MKRITLNKKEQYVELRKRFSMTKNEFIKQWFDSKQDLFGSSSVKPIRVCATVLYLNPLHVSVDEIFPEQY